MASPSRNFKLKEQRFVCPLIHLQLEIILCWNQQDNHLPTLSPCSARSPDRRWSNTLCRSALKRSKWNKMIFSYLLKRHDYTMIYSPIIWIRSFQVMSTKPSITNFTKPKDTIWWIEKNQRTHSHPNLKPSHRITYLERKFSVSSKSLKASASAMLNSFRPPPSSGLTWFGSLEYSSWCWSFCWSWRSNQN